MNTTINKSIILLTIFFCINTFPQEKYEYTKETDTLVLQKLEQWQNLKFGLMMHWGPYSQWGVTESWTICSEDWINRKSDDYNEYKLQYKKLKNTFNPTDFNPAKWVQAAKDAGMKYVVFTTKHHDGFSMFDTKQTDYKITDEDSPFHTNPKANITKEIFSAFQKENFMIGAYFSKPDWNNNNYWWKYYATPDRHVNYDIKKYPERWEKFVEFTHNQIDELMTDYGRVDILWLDGGWVRQRSETEIEEAKENNPYNFCRIQNQDINMPLLVKKARSKQPGLIVVDRTVSGPYENYLTPENKVPDTPLPYPWETCMPMARSWSYVPNDNYKSARRLIHLLADIVSKGGNFLLNIGPGPKGDFDQTAYDRLKEIGDWMKVNGEAIYNSHPVEPYKEGNVCFTQLQDETVYAIYLTDEREDSLPEKLSFSKFCPSPNSEIELLGTNTKIKWHKTDNGCELEIPESVHENLPSEYALVFKIKKVP
jgi:alpha-L-fucosidase